jgi:hypothetical protein
MKNQVTAFVVAAFLLAACGGGGGGSKGGTNSALAIVDNQAFSLSEDTPFTGTIQIRPKSGTTARVEQASPPQKGTVTNLASTGTFSYQPNSNAFGADSFVVRVTDESGVSGTATISLNIAPVNDPPVASNQTLRFARGTQPSWDALATASDVENDALTIQLDNSANGNETNPDVGTAKLVGGTIQLTLPQDFVGVSRVRYTVKDSAGASSPATAVIYVGMQPLEVWYTFGQYDGDMNVYASDLLRERKVSSFVSPSRAVSVQFSADTKVAVIDESRDGRVAALWTVSTQAPEAPQLLTQSLAMDERISKHIVNGDGSWIAYVIENAIGAKKLWIAPKSAPTQRRELKLPDSFSYWEQEQITSPMVFNSAGSALYFVARSSNSGLQYLYRTNVSSGDPISLVPTANVFTIVNYFGVSPDDSYLVVQGVFEADSGIARITRSNPSQRVLLSPPESIGSVVADRSLSHVAYVTYGLAPDSKGDRLLVSNVLGQQNWSEYVAPDATRTGPIQPINVSAQNTHVLVQSWSKIGDRYQVDLAEAVGNGVLSTVSPPPPIGDTSQSTGRYDLGSDAIFYSYASNIDPWRFLEARDSSPTTSVDLFAPGAFLNPVFSTNMAVVGLAHTRNIPSEPYTDVRIANRDAPGQMINVTSGHFRITDVLVHGLVDMP